MKRVYIVNGSADYVRMFRANGWMDCKELREADLVCFTGGADVSPDYYGDAKHPYTQNNRERDAYEQKVYEAAKEMDIPCVGICRGGQFLNVMSGGRLYQHVERHAIGGMHELVDLRSGETIHVTSTHHQMFMPGERAITIATAQMGGEREWYDHEVFKRDVSDEDYEVLFYPHTRSLCFQPHPEYMLESRMTSWFFELINWHLFNE